MSRSTFELMDLASGNLIFYGTRKQCLEIVVELNDRELALGRYREPEGYTQIAWGEELLKMARK